MIEPFEKWDIGFVEPINSTYLNKNYILVCRDFVFLFFLTAPPPISLAAAPGWMAVTTKLLVLNLLLRV